MNVAEEILRAGAPGATAIRFRADAERTDVTYGELLERVRQVAEALRASGVQAEQRVLLVLPDCPELVYAFLGAIWAGAVPVLANPFLRAEEHAFFLADTRARVVVATEAHAPDLAARAAALPHPAEIWTVGAQHRGTFWSGIARASATPAAFDAHPEDAAFWLYSSGTTGKPKGTIHLQRAIPGVIESYGKTVLSTDPKDIVYATSKLFFAYGLGASLYLPLSAGACVVLSPDPFQPARTWRLLAEEKPTLFFAVPSVYRALLDQPPAAGDALAATRRCLSAGEGLPPRIFEEWRERFGKEILDGIGSTELLHIYLSNLPGDAMPGTLGRPLPGYEIEIVDEHGRPLADGQAGVLRVRGPSVAAGYWHRLQATRGAFQGGWYASGDQAVRGSDGRVRVLGRADDMLKISGQWVAPADVEAVICRVEGVKECAVVGRAGAAGLTELVACLVVEGDGDEVAGRVEAHVSKTLPRFRRPREIRVLDSLPRTATGKLQRFRLRELLDVV